LAPGTTTDANPLSQSESNADPLAPKAAPAAKTRYAARGQFVKAKKVKAKKDKATDKALATPTPMTTQEKATQQTQAAPLGLNGDTAKKKKKKRAKGEAKERLQPKPKDPNAVPQKNPDGSYPTPYHPANSTAPASPTPNGGSTLPPVTTPAPTHHRQAIRRQRRPTPIQPRLRSRSRPQREQHHARAPALAFRFYAPDLRGILEIYERVLRRGCGEVRQ